MKKIILGFIWFFLLNLWVVFWIWTVTTSQESDFPYSEWRWSATDDIWSYVKYKWWSSTSLWKRILNAEWIRERNAWYYIRNIINWFLWFLWFIAMIMIIYSFYMILFSEKWEDDYNKAIKYLWKATMAIFMIWLSRLFVWWVFTVFFKASNF
jgi:hypothetical protein